MFNTVLSQSLDKYRARPSSSIAQCCHSELSWLKAEDEMICNSRSRHPEGVTNRDCSTVYVDPVHRNAQLFAVSDHHHSESFIDFPEVNVPDTQAVVV